MICCDQCTVWQHIICVGVAPGAIPETYYCEKCNPRKIDVKAAKKVQTKFIADSNLNGSVLNNLFAAGPPDSGIGSQSSSPNASSLNETKAVELTLRQNDPANKDKLKSAKEKDGVVKKRRSSVSEASSLKRVKPKSEKLRRDSGRDVSNNDKVKLAKTFRRVSSRIIPANLPLNFTQSYFHSLILIHAAKLVKNSLFKGELR